MRIKSEGVAGLSDLIGKIYECALEPALWDDTLSQIVSAFSPAEWDVAMLMWERTMPRPAVRFIGTTGLVAHARDIYAAIWAGKHLWSRAISALPAGRVVDTDEIVPRAQLLASDLYRQFLSTWNMEQCVAVVLDREAGGRLALALPGPPGRELQGLKRGLRLIAPHLQRACRISRRIGEADLRAASAEAALDHAPTAILTLRRDLSIVTMNAKAAALEAEGVFTHRNGRLHFASNTAQAAIRNLAEGRHERSIALSLEARDARPRALLAARIDLAKTTSLSGALEGACVLVSIGARSDAPLIAIDRLSAWFGLTPTEARLAAALAGGSTIAAYAEQRSITDNAARFLLKGIFRKTGTHRQAELISVLKSVPAG